MQKAKPVGKPVVEPSPGERLAKFLEDWLGSKGNPCARDALNIGASDDAMERRKIRVRAQQAIEALASEELRLACVAAGFRPIVELIELLPFDGPLPSRPIDHAQPARWRFRPRPTDATPTELRVEDPAKLLAALAEGVVPEWIRCVTAPATPKPDDGAVTGTELAILEAARRDTDTGLSELRHALLEVIRLSDVLKSSVAERQGLSESVARGAWTARWKDEYQHWVRAMRDALDAIGRPAVAAFMDRDSHPNPDLCWTARVRDQLHRLEASLHPMKEGADGLGFIRGGATTLPQAFPWPLDNLRRMVGELPLIAPSAAPTVQRADDGHSTPATRSIVDSGSDLITFNDKERKMLHVMNSKDGQFLWVAKVLGDHAGFGDETARLFIKRLRDHGLAERPDGEKSGARLTMAGRKVAKGDFSIPQD